MYYTVTDGLSNNNDKNVIDYIHIEIKSHTTFHKKTQDFFAIYIYIWFWPFAHNWWTFYMLKILIQI